MQPVDFDGSNVVLGDDQPEYIDLPAFRDKDGCVVTCWQLSWIERLVVLFTGRLWFSQLTFGDMLQPQLPSVQCPLEDLNEVFHGDE